MQCIDKQLDLSPNSYDFDPPLKRKEPSVPGYWTVEELATELGVSERYVQYLIKGNPKAHIRIRLKAYKAGPTFLVSDAEALAYLWEKRQTQKS